jgi:hypothetical protein
LVRFAVEPAIDFTVDFIVDEHLLRRFLEQIRLRARAGFVRWFDIAK